MVSGRARARKLRFEDEALELFVLLTGGDTRQIENELEKLQLYTSGGTGAVPSSNGTDGRISVDDVRQLVPLSRAGVIFELGNALAVCDLHRACADACAGFRCPGTTRP